MDPRCVLLTSFLHVHVILRNLHYTCVLDCTKTCDNWSTLEISMKIFYWVPCGYHTVIVRGTVMWASMLNLAKTSTQICFRVNQDWNGTTKCAYIILLDWRFRWFLIATPKNRMSRTMTMILLQPVKLNQKLKTTFLKMLQIPMMIKLYCFNCIH